MINERYVSILDTFTILACSRGSFKTERESRRAIVTKERKSERGLGRVGKPFSGELKDKQLRLHTATAAAVISGPETSCYSSDPPFIRSMILLNSSRYRISQLARFDNLADFFCKSRWFKQMLSFQGKNFPQSFYHV